MPVRDLEILRSEMIQDCKTLATRARRRECTHACTGEPVCIPSPRHGPKVRSAGEGWTEWLWMSSSFWSLQILWKKKEASD